MTGQTQKGVEGPRLRTGGRSARVVAAVLDATLTCLVEAGYEALAIGEVARRAHVHETSIYRRWQTKARVVADAVIRAAARDTPAPDTGTFKGDAKAIMERVRLRLRTPVGRAISEVVASQSAELEGMRREYWTSRLDTIRVMVERAVTRGELPVSADPRFVMDLLTGPLFVRRTSGGQVTRAYVERVVDGACRALLK